MTIYVSPAVLRAASPKEDPNLIQPLADAMNEFFPHPLFDIATENRVENALAQFLIESDYFKTLTEYASGDAYDTRTDLGNTPQRDGDGRLYKGRGILQLTGKANYRKASQELKKLFGIDVDLVKNPHLAGEPRLSVLIACLYWRRKKLNALADKDDVREITRRINGGFNHLKERQAAREKFRHLIKSSDPGSDRIGPATSSTAIAALQKVLKDKNYPVGRIDGRWGAMTRDAILALKAQNNLDVSDPTISLAEATAAAPRSIETRRDATVADLRAEGSATVKGADKAQIAGGVGAALPLFGYGAKVLVGDGQGTPGVLDKAEEVSSYWQRIAALIDPFTGLASWIGDNLWIVLPAIGGAAIWYGYRVKQKRLEDFKAGKSG